MEGQFEPRLDISHQGNINHNYYDMKSSMDDKNIYDDSQKDDSTDGKKYPEYCQTMTVTGRSDSNYYNY